MTTKYHFLLETMKIFYGIFVYILIIFIFHGREKENEREEEREGVSTRTRLLLFITKLTYCHLIWILIVGVSCIYLLVSYMCWICKVLNESFHIVCKIIFKYKTLFILPTYYLFIGKESVWGLAEWVYCFHYRTVGCVIWCSLAAFRRQRMSETGLILSRTDTAVGSLPVVTWRLLKDGKQSFFFFT